MPFTIDRNKGKAIQATDREAGERTDQLWEAISNSQPNKKEKTAVLTYPADEVKPNATGITSLNNRNILSIKNSAQTSRKPIHGHRVFMPGKPAIEKFYEVGQSPSIETSSDILVHAISSRRGVFQFISRKAQYYG